MIPVMGPNARRLLQSLTDADLSAEAFPFGTSREIDLGCGFVRATRITYVGELGWELLIPADLAVHVYDTIAEAGQEYGLRPAGYHALDSLRMEKAYRSWGHDISAGDTPLEAGLGFAVAWDKPGGFTGRDALLRQKEAGVGRRLVQFALRRPRRLRLPRRAGLPRRRPGRPGQLGRLRPHPRPHRRARLRDRARTGHAALLVRRRGVRDRDRRPTRVPADASPRAPAADRRPGHADGTPPRAISRPAATDHPHPARLGA